MLLTAAACSGGRQPQAQPTRSSVIQPPSPSPTAGTRPARPGAVCGRITTVSGDRARVVVVKGRPTCADAMRVFQKYNDPATPAEGSAGLAVIGHWTCQTRRTTTTCTSRTAVIQSRA